MQNKVLHQEVLVLLDALWDHRDIRRQYEYEAFEKAGMTKIGRLLGKFPRPNMHAAKIAFETNFYSTLWNALQELELVRSGKTAADVFVPTMRAVFIERGKYRVEVCLTRDREPILIGDYHHVEVANRWIIENGKEWLRQNGFPQVTPKHIT